MGRSKEEMEGVTLLGNKDVKYSMDYCLLYTSPSPRD